MSDAQSTSKNRRKAPGFGLLASLLFHAAVVGFLLLWFYSPSTQQIVAAGEGEGGEGGGGSIEVGVADASQILGFAKPKEVAFVGEDKSAINNARVEQEKPEESEEALLPPTEKQKPKPDAVKTDRPVAPQEEKVFTGKEERGSSASQTAQVGRSYGSPTPSVSGGVSIGQGSGAGNGLPGGSAYGRLIQQILSRNYNPPIADNAQPQEVIMTLRIARNGTILSIVGGRVGSQYIKQRTSIALVNNAAERAVLAANPLPPFPAGFLSNVDEAVAEVRFRYPK